MLPLVQFVNYFGWQYNISISSGLLCNSPIFKCTISVNSIDRKCISKALKKGQIWGCYCILFYKSIDSNWFHFKLSLFGYLTLCFRPRISYHSTNQSQSPPFCSCTNGRAWEPALQVLPLWNSLLSMILSLEQIATALDIINYVLLITVE